MNVMRRFAESRVPRPESRVPSPASRVPRPESRVPMSPIPPFAANTVRTITVRTLTAPLTHPLSIFRRVIRHMDRQTNSMPRPAA